MKLKKLLNKLNSELQTEGYKGIRGIPDGSGPSPNMSGRGKGNCPKLEDFDSKEEYEKELKKWKSKKKEEQV